LRRHGSNSNVITNTTVTQRGGVVGVARCTAPVRHAVVHYTLKKEAIHRGRRLSQLH